jgi:hypothetical protein
MAKLVFSPSEHACRFTFVLEVGANRGHRIGGVQYYAGGADALGQSYCCYFATGVLDVCYQGQSPIPMGGVCQDVYALALKEGWVVGTPQTDDLFLFVDEATNRAHHIGIVCDDGEGVAGNTSKDGTSSNGDGMHKHPIRAPQGSRIVYVRTPRDD